MKIPSEPFVRGAFADLPDTPRVPHRFGDTKLAHVRLTTPLLGRCDAAVRTFGSGPPLLLVHGLMTTSYSWRYVLEPLGKHFTLHMPDLPGNGASDKPSAPAYHPEALAEWLGAVVDALDIRGCPVVGNSMGGYLSMRLALRDPGAMSRLVNVHSPGLPEPRLYALAAALRIPFAKAGLARFVRLSPERWAHRNVHYWDESLKSREEARIYGGQLASPEGSTAFVKHLAETMAIGPIRAFRDTLAARRERGEGFPVPLLLLYAERDPMVPPRFGEELARLVPDAKLVMLREASHFAHVDGVERFLPPVLSFLSVSDTP